jgi:hypothetical protein
MAGGDGSSVPYEQNDEENPSLPSSSPFYNFVNTVHYSKYRRLCSIFCVSSSVGINNEIRTLFILVEIDRF